MSEFCVFGGTTEGREIVEFLCAQGVPVTACVATEYGGSLLEPAEGLTVLSGKLDEEGMRELFRKERFDLVVDATHPYARLATENIAAAAAETGTRYLRLLREASEAAEDAVFVQGAGAAAEYLSGVEGNVLLTTGSKELSAYAGMKGFAERAYARVLPLPSSLESCKEAGVSPNHILAVQGPFSEEMNEAMIRFASAKYLVTKDSGEAGGFGEKVAAARKAGAKLVVIGRPPQEEGDGLAATIRKLCDEYGFTAVPKVSVVGIGPGSEGSMTGEARRAIAEAECLIGAQRMLEAVASPGQKLHAAIASEDIAGYIKEHPEYRRFAVVMSGDTGFYSGTKKLLPLLEGCRTEVLPGISSLAFLCARLGASYEDVKAVSLHGRERDVARDVRENGKVFVLVGGENGMGELCRRLADAGLGDCRVSAGERLSYPDEKITRGTAEELAGMTFGSLCCGLIENPEPHNVVTHGLPDAEFLRGADDAGAVPMTKSEVRSVSLSKLRLTSDAVCWDVGAGTGSVAIEMALQAKEGEVYAIERRSGAADLLRDNKERFGVNNLTVVEGTAPEACEDLPAPTHVFVGGSSGNMRQILEQIERKNPEARVVATAVTLESVAELTECLKHIGLAESEVVSVQVARDRKAGPYHLMTANNPIYVFTMRLGRKEG